MSIAELERFAADLKSNKGLRTEAEKAAAGTSHATPTDRVAAFAAAKGYAFTADEADDYLTAKQLSDAELEGVTGGREINANAVHGAMLETLRANKGMEEDRARRIQTLMQTMNDSQQASADMASTFIDVLRGISSKIYH